MYRKRFYILIFLLMITIAGFILTSDTFVITRNEYMNQYYLNIGIDLVADSTNANDMKKIPLICKKPLIKLLKMVVE